MEKEVQKSETQSNEKLYESVPPGENQLHRK